ncbi:MAG TPA: phage tail sheath subtilisin-like domain-containing protein [Candidatus Eisenbacteria bacterium]|nr:phage tail sheath subtilisin-like domain-containing protein [Candidatus Eisenbacteria bacterium]
MPVAPTYPGVYVEEIPSGVRTIVGVATSITAFLGRAPRGPVDEPVTITSFSDFERRFGSLSPDYPLSYAVNDFYRNGGNLAIVVRLFQSAEGDDGTVRFKVGDLTLKAASPGSWGAKLTGKSDALTGKTAEEVRTRLDLPDDAAVFNLRMEDPGTGVIEVIRSLSVADSSRRIDKVLEAESTLVRWDGALDATNIANPTGSYAPLEAESKDVKAKEEALQAAKDASAAKPEDQALKDAVSAAETAVTAAKATLRAKAEGTALKQDVTNASEELKAAQAELKTAKEAAPPDAAAVAAAETKVDQKEAALKDKAQALANSIGGDSDPLGNSEDFIGEEGEKSGMYSLEKTDLFNLLCIPADSRDFDVPLAVWSKALSYCVRRKAMLIVDSPRQWGSNAATAAQSAINGLAQLNLNGTDARNAVLFFPQVVQLDPKNEDRPDTFVPCGIVAGVMARTDVQRGVWKAPAGLDAGLSGVSGLQVDLTDDENGRLNPLGINCLRTFPISGRVVWGSRTLRGADELADEYKYVPVRRLALFLEESLKRGTKWVVFEPNDEPLWAQIRLNVGAFMHNLFRQGAFQGTTPRDAYFVMCDKHTTTQNDINLGIVNIVVGFAPLKPAEFVIIKLQQIAGTIET